MTDLEQADAVVAGLTQKFTWEWLVRNVKWDKGVVPLKIEGTTASLYVNRVGDNYFGFVLQQLSPNANLPFHYRLFMDDGLDDR